MIGILQEHTYTFALLKESVYKALEEFSLNGEEITRGKGIAADVEKRFIATLNQCARRVMLSFPLLRRSDEIEFTRGEDEMISACQPEGLYEICRLYAKGGAELPMCRVRISGGRIYCDAFGDGDRAIVEYTVKANEFTPETCADEKITLPDITCDALVYLTAAELCPTEYSELYSRLIYKYNDVALNCYNASPLGSRRNSLFAGGRRAPLGRRAKWGM